MPGPGLHSTFEFKDLCAALGAEIGHYAEDAAAAAPLRIGGRATGRHRSSKEF